MKSHESFMSQIVFCLLKIISLTLFMCVDYSIVILGLLRVKKKNFFFVLTRCVLELVAPNIDC